MRVLLQTTLICLLLILAPVGWANSELSSWYSKGQNNQVKLRVDLFLSSTCPHCQKADAFFHELNAPWLDVHRYVINQDKAALEAFYQRLRQVQIDDYSVPAIFFCNSRWVGFDQASTTGQTLLRGLQYCQKQIMGEGSLTPRTVNLLNQLGNASWFNANMTSKPSLAMYTLGMALTDGLGPCSLFGVLALFAFLWLYKEGGVRVGLGILFLLVLILIHHFQSSHIILFDQIVAWLRIPAALVGLWLIIYVFLIYYKGIAAYPHFAVPLLVAATAFVIQAYQQNCTPNFAIIYQQWLDRQGLSVIQQGFWEATYQLIYILPLAVIVFFLVYFRNHIRLQKIQPFLSRVAWCLLLIIGIFLILFPQGFSYLSLSLAALILALLIQQRLVGLTGLEPFL